MFGKVVINIFDPKLFDEYKLIMENKKLKERFELVLCIFDFIDFREDYNGERRLKKKRISELGNKEDMKTISIDDSEELYFIIKNIYENNKKM